MSFRIQTSWDARDCVALALWWAETLGWEFEYLDPEQFNGLVSQGFCSEDDIIRLADGRLSWRDGAAIHHPSEPTLRMYFQNVPEGKVVKNRVHIDVLVGADQVAAETEKLKARGANYLATHSQGPHSWNVMQDIEGNEFCVS